MPTATQYYGNTMANKTDNIAHTFIGNRLPHYNRQPMSKLKLKETKAKSKAKKAIKKKWMIKFNDEIVSDPILLHSIPGTDDKYEDRETNAYYTPQECNDNEVFFSDEKDAENWVDGFRAGLYYIKDKINMML